MDHKKPAKHSPNSLKPPISRHPAIGYYMTKVMVGTPSQIPHLVVDTASEDTWTQYEGCTNCFPLRQGSFNRSKSQFYHPLPCEDPLCDPFICINGSCAYDVKCYGTGSFETYSKGQVGSDTFIFQDSNRSVEGFPKTVFGCGLDNYNFPWSKLGENNTISGILGLGLGRRSIFMQYANQIKRRVSYCLPSWYARTGTYTLLNFGDDARIGGRPGTAVQTTALIPNVSKYMVNLMDISIYGRRLNIDPAVFRLRSNHTGGFFFDSGSPHSVLVQTAYSAVKEQIIEYFSSNYSWTPMPPQPGKLDLCYEVPRGKYTFPTMTYHFAGADLHLLSKNVFQSFNGGFRLMILPVRDGGSSLIGAFHQMNYRFLF